MQDGIGQNKTLNFHAENTSNQESAHAGFVKSDKLVPTKSVGPLDNRSSLVRPNLALWIVSDSVTGQTFDTIVKSTQPIHVWNLDDLTNIPDNSHWVLYMDEHSNYQIKLEPSN
ncbi:hypothetical protein H0H93_012684 [Arthromyces matolae]|nr:hypothetical protein H0H93_012684 [Arthromyces matolae]